MTSTAASRSPESDCCQRTCQCRGSRCGALPRAGTAWLARVARSAPLRGRHRTRLGIMNPSGSLNPSPRTLEVDSVARFDQLVGAGAKTMHGWHAQSLDLRGRAPVLAAMEAEGAIFLGCTFDSGVEDSLRRRGALIFPKLAGVPFDAYRGRAVHAPGALRRHRRRAVRGNPGCPRVPMEHPPRPAPAPRCHAGGRPARPRHR